MILLYIDQRYIAIMSEAPVSAEDPAGDALPDACSNGDNDVASPSEFLRGVVVLPPRQRNHSTSSPVPVLALPLIRIDEPVQSIKQALSDIVGLAHITNYRLELETDVPTNTVPWNPELISPFTGRDAVIAVPAAVKSLDDEEIAKEFRKMVLDDWGDLSMMDGGVSDGCAFRMVLQRYDAATVKDHLTRLRQFLQGNPPSSMAFEEDDQAPPVQAEEEEEVESTKKSEQTNQMLMLPEYQMVTGDKLGNYFYLACGEDPSLYHGKEDLEVRALKKKKKGKNGNDEVAVVAEEKEIREKLPIWNQCDEKCWIECEIGYSGFHPPPSSRKLTGDIAYFELVMPNVPVVHVTATRAGFYVNRSVTGKGSPEFNPSPADKPCFSHTLLDCLLQASVPFQVAWTKSLEASQLRIATIRELNTSSPHLALFRLAVRGDFGGFTRSTVAAAAGFQNLGATFHSPSWLVPTPCLDGVDGGTWNKNHLHGYQSSRMEEDLINSHGIDLRSGGGRDWNEEFQLAREMPVTTLTERIERARLLLKIMTEYGEATILGVKAIAEGLVAPMNPSESMRTQVYLHNNIFFSRAVDTGPETFKIHKGDAAARKQANRDLQCNQILYRMENTGISSLATVLIDYLGTRYVCQSVLPGILIGERAHKLLLGSVEVGVPLSWDDEFHKLLEDKLGESMMIATRSVPRHPLTEKRMAQLEQLKKELPAMPPQLVPPIVQQPKEDVEPNAVMDTCVPLEAKGIMGSDQRRYLLDIGRLTPRDANWTPKAMGGTGNFESQEHVAGSKSGGLIPSSLEDDEWTLCVLRPELVHRFTQISLSRYLVEKQAKELEEKKKKIASKPSDASVDNEGRKQESESDGSSSNKQASGLSDDDLAYVKSLRLNVNVLLPDVKSFEDNSEETASVAQRDEQKVRDAAVFLWDEVIPKMTLAIKEEMGQQLPVDGQTLTEFIHRGGINCRYLGRIALLAQEQEAVDAKVNEDFKLGRLSGMTRKTMPKFWLELVECEIVARAAKHVLDAYLNECGGVAAAQPAQTVASFLSALVSETEETAAQTETRLGKRAVSDPDEEDFGMLVISDVGGGGDSMPSSVRSRTEVWRDIEAEVGRRFRYTLSLYNTGNKSGRARYVPLLRRVCQRAGIRLAAKDYDIGSKCLCSGGSSHGGRLTLSYPISPLDVVDIVPMVKHAAASNEGFYPCSIGQIITLPPLQVSLQDARVALEHAHLQTKARALAKGFELAQEAFALFQRVTETASHPGVVEALELMTHILHEAGDLQMAISHGEKALSLSLQTSGFDTINALNSHLTLFQLYHSANNHVRAVKHLRAVIYLIETMAGPNHIECFNSYHKLGSAYSQEEWKGQYLHSALKFCEEAAKRDSSDRLLEGIAAKHLAKVLADTGNYKDAVVWEKKACNVLSGFLGTEHTWAKESNAKLQELTQLAVQKGSRLVQNEVKLEEEAKAAAIAADLLAAEDALSTPKKKAKKKKSKK